MPFAWHFGSGPWWLFILFGLVVLGLLVLGLVLMARERRDAQPPTTWTPTAGSAWGRPTPEEILRERLARSEISVEEYQRIMVALTTDPTRAMPPPTAPMNAEAPTAPVSTAGPDPNVPPGPPEEPPQV